MAHLTPTVDGRKMRLAREAADLTVNQLVERLRQDEDIDRNPNTIRNVELGHARPSLELFNAYCRVVGADREDLLLKPRRGRVAG
jgi:transcriptional regulator with XRE-family HTH domain